MEIYVSVAFVMLGLMGCSGGDGGSSATNDTTVSPPSDLTDMTFLWDDDSAAIYFADRTNAKDVGDDGKLSIVTMPYNYRGTGNTAILSLRGIALVSAPIPIYQIFVWKLNFTSADGGTYEGGLSMGFDANIDKLDPSVDEIEYTDSGKFELLDGVHSPD